MNPAEIDNRIQKLVDSRLFGESQLKIGIEQLIHDVLLPYRQIAKSNATVVKTETEAAIKKPE